MINIVYTADEGYAMQIAVSMTSVLESNPDTDICFFILSDTYSEKTQNRFKKLQDKYGCKIHIIDITFQMKLLEDTVFYQAADIGKNGLITFMYARIFIDSALPDSVDKALYIDGDTIIQGDIKGLFDIKLRDDCIIGAIRDIWPNSYNPVIGHNISDAYFMSGLLLIDRKLWRRNHTEQKILSHMHILKTKYFMHDQDVINVCLKNKIDTLPLGWGGIYHQGLYTGRYPLVLWKDGEGILYEG